MEALMRPSVPVARKRPRASSYYYGRVALVLQRRQAGDTGPVTSFDSTIFRSRGTTPMGTLDASFGTVGASYPRLARRHFSRSRVLQPDGKTRGWRARLHVNAFFVNKLMSARLVTSSSSDTIPMQPRYEFGSGGRVLRISPEGSISFQQGAGPGSSTPDGSWWRRGSRGRAATPIRLARTWSGRARPRRRRGAAAAGPRCWAPPATTCSGGLLGRMSFSACAQRHDPRLRGDDILCGGGVTTSSSAVTHRPAVRRTGNDMLFGDRGLSPSTGDDSLHGGTAGTRSSGRGPISCSSRAATIGSTAMPVRTRSMAVTAGPVQRSTGAQHVESCESGRVRRPPDPPRDPPRQPIRSRRYPTLQGARELGPGWHGGRNTEAAVAAATPAATG